MPVTVPVTPVATSERHCTGIVFSMPVGGKLTAQAMFTYVDRDSSGAIVLLRPDASVTITQEEIAALPAFNTAYSQLSALVHAKRQTS